jgi:MFS family permease
MELATYSSQQRMRSLAAVICAVFSVGVAVGAVTPLLSLLLERRGVSETVIGLNGAMFPLAVLVFGPFLPRLMGRLGTLRSIYLSISMLTATVLLLPVLPTIGAWFILRFIAGGAGAISWIVTETWINMMATNETRGRVMAIYATMLAAGFSMGPAMLRLTGIDGYLPFIAVAAALSVSVVPFFFVRDVAPPMPERPTNHVIHLMRIAPVVMLAGLAGGAIETALFTLLPVYGLRVALAEGTAVLMLTFYYIGNLILQFPLGWLADRFDRRAALCWCVGIVLICAPLLPVLAPTGMPLLAMLIFWGGASMAMYTLSLALMGEIYPRSDLAGANTAFVMMYEAGSIGGPIAAGAAMEGIGHNGLPLVVGLIAAAYLGFALGTRRRG